MPAKAAGAPPPLRLGGKSVPGWVSTVALLAPAYVWLLLAIFLPLGAMFVFSFMDATPIGGKQIGYTLDQYKIFVTQPFMWKVALWTFQIAIATTLCCAVLGFAGALALVRSGLGRSQGVFLILILLPFWTNGLVRIFSWTMVIREGGFLDAVVQFAWPEAPTLGFLYSRPAIVLGLVHGYVSYMVLTCYIALSSVDDALIEAAASLGARWWTILLKILIPLAAPGVIAGSVLIFVPVVGSFMEPRILGGPAGITLGTVIEDNFTQGFNWPQGAALSFMLLAVVLAIFATFAGVLRRNAQM